MMFYDETNSTEATRSIRNRLHNSGYVSMAHGYSDDQLLTLQAIIMGQPNVTRRQAVEWFIARRVVTTLIDTGYLLTVYDGEESTVEHSKDVNQIVGAMMTTDEDRLLVYPGDWHSVGGNSIGWVYLVYGNDGWDLVSDYTTNLEDAIRPVFDLIREIGP